MWCILSTERVNQNTKHIALNNALKTKHYLVALVLVWLITKMAVDPCWRFYYLIIISESLYPHMHGFQISEQTFEDTITHSKSAKNAWAIGGTFLGWILCNSLFSVKCVEFFHSNINILNIFYSNFQWVVYCSRPQAENNILHWKLV